MNKIEDVQISRPRTLVDGLGYRCDVSFKLSGKEKKAYIFVPSHVSVSAYKNTADDVIKNGIENMLITGGVQEQYEMDNTYYFEFVGDPFNMLDTGFALLDTKPSWADMVLAVEYYKQSGVL